MILIASGIHVLPQCVSGLCQGNSHQFISTFERRQIDKASEDVNGVFVEISSEIGARSEHCSVFDRQFRPRQVPQVESPNVVI